MSKKVLSYEQEGASLESRQVLFYEQEGACLESRRCYLWGQDRCVYMVTVRCAYVVKTGGRYLFQKF
jgi:hypothetical protein